MSHNGIDPYKNPHSKRKQKRRAKVRAEQVCKLSLSTQVLDESDWFLQLECEVQGVRAESTTFKKEKALKPGDSARGKQKYQRASKPLI